jgi:hypothetical protein
LHHAREHGKRRVIYAIPYLSIIEQTADVFRDIFDEDVIEYHSNLDPDKETARSRLAAENWDAPLIVTTNVQLFESLYAARTSRCRKLHNLVDSVVILDEVQLLPPDFLEPCLSAIRTLSAYYGITFVLCTATQPAFQPREINAKPFKGLPDVRELMRGGPHVQSPEELPAMSRPSLSLIARPMPASWQEGYRGPSISPRICAERIAPSGFRKSVSVWPPIGNERDPDCPSVRFTWSAPNSSRPAWTSTSRLYFARWLGWTPSRRRQDVAIGRGG